MKADPSLEGDTKRSKERASRVEITAERQGLDAKDLKANFASQAEALRNTESKSAQRSAGSNPWSHLVATGLMTKIGGETGRDISNTIMNHVFKSSQQAAGSNPWSPLVVARNVSNESAKIDNGHQGQNHQVNGSPLMSVEPEMKTSQVSGVEALVERLSVLTLSIKKANSVRNPTKFIYDTAAGCNICNSRDVFVEGSIVMIPKDEISIVGWNTSHGPAVALGIGRLKYLDIDAYFSEDAIGNILGEPALLQEFQAVHSYFPGKLFRDVITVTRQTPRAGDQPMIFRRGVEGIMICPVPGSGVNITAETSDDWIVCSSLLSDDNDPVSLWLEKYGLTKREVQAALVLRKLSKENRNISISRLICVLEGNHDCRAKHVLKKYSTFISMYTGGKLNEIMSHSSEILGSLRSWLPMTESSLATKSTEGDTCACEPTRKMFGNELHSTCRTVGSNYDSPLHKVREASLPECLASNFSDSESWAALSIAKLKLSYGELMVALFAVDVGLASADTFVTLTLKQKGYSLAGIARLEQVERLHRLTSFVNLETLKNMLHNKVIEVDGLNPRDVISFRKDVHGSDCPCHEGKVKLPSAIKNVNLSKMNSESCHVDVMTTTTDDKLHRYLNLIGVDAATQCIFEVKVPSLAEDALATGLLEIEKWYKSHKRPLSQFVLDNAAGFSAKALIETCQKRNITVMYVTPDLHVKLAEAAIKIIKSLVRTTVVDRESRGKFITPFVTHLITWVVGSINYSLRSGSKHQTPWTRFTGNKIDMNIHFRVAFLDIVICHKLIQERTNNLQSRGFVGLVVARDRSARGAFQVINLETMRICKRYHFKLVDSPNLRKYVNDKLQEPIFKSNYIAAEDSEIATADINDFEVNPEDIEKLHIEIARLTAEAKPKQPIVEGVGAVASEVTTNVKDLGIIANPDDMEVNPEVEEPIQRITKFPYKKKAKPVKPILTVDASLSIPKRPIRGQVIPQVAAIQGRPKNRSALPKVEVIKNSKAFTIPQLSDGTCMFASVAYCYKKGSVEADPLALRDLVCNFMAQNLKFEFNGIQIDDLIDTIRIDLAGREGITTLDTTADYIDYMRKSSSFGDSLELQIIAYIRKVALLIFHQKPDGFQFRQAITEFCEEGKIIYLNFTGEIHYETLIIDDAETRLRHRLQYKISHPPEVGNSNFDYDVNDLTPSTFDFESHEDYMELQRVINISSDEAMALARNPAFDPADEEFDEEDITKYVSDLEELSVLVASINVKEPRPYSSVYEDYYKSDAAVMEDLVTDSDFLECCNRIEEETVLAAVPAKYAPKKPKTTGSLRERLGDEVVDEASIKEMRQILHKEVWEGVTTELVRELHRQGIQIVPLIELIKEKLTAEGEHEKVKSRIIVLGSEQTKVHRSRTEAPTAQLQSFYIFIFIAAKRGIRIMSLDVTGAFLNAKLKPDEVVYVRLNRKMTKILCEINPSWNQYVLKDGTMVVRLWKCLYGMAISPQRWFKTMDAVLRRLGFKPSEFDLCLYVLIEANDVMNLALLYVDDLALACENKDLERRIIEEMKEEFEGVSIQQGDAISYLGFNIRQSSEGISLDQTGYIAKMVKALNLKKIPKYNNPFASNFKVNQDRYLTPTSEANPKTLWLMKHLAMSLMYLASRTRRDLLFAASFFAGIKCPEDEDIEAVKRAIVYAYNTVDKKQFFYRKGPMELSMVGDASHSLFVDTRGQGCAIIYGDEHSAALEMTSNVEKFQSKSSYESEIVLQNKLAMMGKRTAQLFAEIGLPMPMPMKQYCDHQAVVNTANQEHLLKSGQSKFMSRNLFQLFSEVESGTIDFRWVKSEDNSADIGTKPLQGSQFQTQADQTFSRLEGLSDPRGKADNYDSDPE